MAIRQGTVEGVVVDNFDVIVLPIMATDECAEFEDEDSFNLAAFAAITPDDPEEDAIWEKYLHV